MPKTREDFGLDSGLQTDYDAVVAASFEPNAQYAAKAGTGDEPMLKLTMESPDLDKPVVQYYSIGSGKRWKASKDASEITSEANPDSHRFNMNSSAGKLVARMFELVGGGDANKGQDFFIARDCYMTQAGFYAGLKFHMNQEKTKTQSGESNIMLPDKYLGEEKVAAKTPAGVDLDKIVIDNAQGKTDRELKAFAVKNDVLKAPENAAYLRDLISGTKLANLEKEEKITKGPDGKYI